MSISNFGVNVNPETSEMIQKLAFKLGCTWCSGDYDVKNEEYPQLFISIDECLSYSSSGTNPYNKEMVSLEEAIKRLLPLSKEIAFKDLPDFKFFKYDNFLYLKVQISRYCNAIGTFTTPNMGRFFEETTFITPIEVEIKEKVEKNS